MRLSQAECTLYAAVDSVEFCADLTLSISVSQSSAANPVKLPLYSTAGKLKNRNNLLMKLAGSTWGDSTNTPRSCSGALLFSSRVLRPSLVTLCSHKSGRCTVELYHASHLWYPPFYTSPMGHGFQCSPTLNRQPYEGRLPLTSWWRKSSNMTVGQFSLISLAHHCYD